MEKAIEYVEKNRRKGETHRQSSCRSCRSTPQTRCARHCPDSEIIDALFTLERLRARKTPEELKLLKFASEHVIESMLAVIANHGPGTTKQELAEALKREEVNRGLTFEYCLVACGTSHNRAPSEQRWEQGEVLSLDSGGNYHGYIGDVCRMAILGEPDAELEDLLGEIEAVQRAAMKPIKAGVIGGEIYAVAEERHEEIETSQPHAFPRARHGAGQPRSAAADRHRPGPL